MMPTHDKKRKRAADALTKDGVGLSTAPASLPDQEEQLLTDILFGWARTRSTTAIGSALGTSHAKRKASQPAWNDDDDEGVAVDVAGTARLRKLRRDHNESVVSGREYQERARSRLASSSGAAGGPAPDWSLAPSERTVVRRQGKGVVASSRGEVEEEDGEEEEEEEEQDGDDVSALLRSSAPLTARARALPPDVLGVSRLRDGTASDPPRAVVQALAWHPTAQGGVLMTASLDARLRFFRVDGKKNPSLASVHLPGLPITSAAWTGDGAEVIATGRRPFFYTYDVAGGTAHRIPRLMGREEKSLESCVVSPAPPSSATSCLAFLASSGSVLLASAATKQWCGTLKQDGDVRAAAFSRGPTGGAGGAGPLEYPDLLSVGTGGRVFVWDLRTLRCRGRHEDEGSMAGSAIAAAPDGSRYAVGSATGVVNVYDARTSLDIPPSSSSSSSLFSPVSAPPPTYSVMSLTTGVRTLAWHPNGAGDVLMVASQAKRDALRLVHGASGRVFSNWPTSRTPLHYVTAGAFSPRGAYLAVGNDTGRVLMYRLHHYGAV